MLEEALARDSSPTEASALMLQFLQMELPTGGASAEARFFRLFVPLLDRIFGVMSTDSQDDYRHKEGGWLSAPTPFLRVSRSHSERLPPVPHIRPSQAGAVLAKPSLDSDPVVELIGPSRKTSSKDAKPITLIEAVCQESFIRPHVRFTVPFFAFPKHLQEAWLSVLPSGDMMIATTAESTESKIMTENNVYLVGTVLRHRPESQTELILYKQQHAAPKLEQRLPLQISPRAFNNMPLSPQQQQPSPTKAQPTSDNETHPNAALTMLEYFLFLFIRYPTKTPPQNRAALNRPSSGRGPALHRPKEMHGELIYAYIFQSWLAYFLPYHREDRRSILVDDSSPESELFLRWVIALWLESHAQLVPTAKVAQSWRERRDRAGITDLTPFDLAQSFDLVEGPYQPAPALVQKCLRLVITHAVADPAVALGSSDQDSSRRIWPLTPMMTAMQPAFYNYIRVTLRHASLHSDLSPFYSALELWCLWLEPWKARKSTARAQRIVRNVAGQERLSTSKQDLQDVYDSRWERYIASNLYVYTIPLAIFVRRARELDFSGKVFVRSIKIVQRVFRIFTPLLVDALSRCLAGQSRYQRFVQRHVDLLGKYAPPDRTDLALISLRKDMHSLLEEISLQHSKNIRSLSVYDLMQEQVEGLFGKGVVHGEENKLKHVIDQAKVIAYLPADYQVSPPSVGMSSPNQEVNALVPDRKQDGTLSELGRHQLMDGMAKCSPADIVFHGDKMRSRPGSYEFVWLVDLTVWLSDFVNKKLGLIDGDLASSLRTQPKFGFRVNLRFLADYRNLFWCTILTSVLLWILIAS